MSRSCVGFVDLLDPVTCYTPRACRVGMTQDCRTLNHGSEASDIQSR